MDARLEEIKAILKKYGQEHLLNHYDKLDDVHKQKLLEEIENIDFELVDSLYRSTEKKEKSTKDEITPIDYLDKYKLNEKYKYYENIGKKAIKEGKLAAVTMAGGQGTRLGHNGPKGTYDIGLNSHKSLFELLCDRLKEEGKIRDIPPNLLAGATWGMLKGALDVIINGYFKEEIKDEEMFFQLVENLLFYGLFKSQEK